MKKSKKPTLADLRKRMAEWFSSYVAEHELLPLGQGAVLVLTVEHHQSTHLYSSNLKTRKAFPAVSHDEPMTENDWKVILKLEVFRKPPENSILSCLRGYLVTLRDSDEPLEMLYHHVLQLNTIFQGNGLMYHAFKVSGSTSSRWRGKPKFKVYKRL